MATSSLCADAVADRESAATTANDAPTAATSATAPASLRLHDGHRRAGRWARGSFRVAGVRAQRPRRHAARARSSPEAFEPDEVFESWDRRGIAHFRQPHNFLGLARDVLLEQAPGVLETVFGLGAFENRQYEL